MTFILAVLACLQGEPNTCIGETIELPEVTNAAGCHLVGALRLDDWARTHAGLEVKAANCMARPHSKVAAGPS